MDTTFSAEYRPRAVAARIHLPNRDVLLLLLQLAALWNVWRWLAIRFVNSGEPTWELLPLISLVFFAWINRPTETAPLNSTALMVASVALVVYAASYITAPPVVRAVIAMISLTLVISRWRFATSFHPG